MGQVKGILRVLVPHSSKKGKTRGRYGTSQAHSPQSCPILLQKRQDAESIWGKSNVFSAILSHIASKKARRGDKMGQVKRILRDLVPHSSKKGKTRRKNGTNQTYSPRSYPTKFQERQDAKEKWDKSSAFSAILSHIASDLVFYINAILTAPCYTTFLFFIPGLLEPLYGLQEHLFVHGRIAQKDGRFIFPHIDTIL